MRPISIVIWFRNIKKVCENMVGPGDSPPHFGLDPSSAGHQLYTTIPKLALRNKAKLHLAQKTES